MSQSSSSASSRRARFRAGEAEQRFPLPPVRHHLLQVESLRVGDRALVLGQPDQDGPGLLEELGGEVADVAEALDHDPLALDPRSEPEGLHVLRHPADFAGTEEDAPARGLGPAPDAARR